MLIELSVLSAMLIISISANVFFLLNLKKKPVKTNSRSAEELLSDLLRGTAIVRIERIAPSDVLLRSPR
jgi:hypothetical protein